MTIVPVGHGSGRDDHGTAFFPLVGLVFGLAGVLVDEAAGALPPVPRALAVVTVWSVLSGALHLDATADVADALGGHSREERLRILSDSRLGSFGAITLVLLLAWKVTALAVLAEGMRLPAILLAPVIGRSGLILAAAGLPAAKPDGSGASFVRSLEGRATGVGAASAGLAALVLGAGGILALVVAALGLVSVRALAMRLFGGVTGDLVGASGELTETLVLVVLALYGSAA